MSRVGEEQCQRAQVNSMNRWPSPPPMSFPKAITLIIHQFTPVATLRFSYDQLIKNKRDQICFMDELAHFYGSKLLYALECSRKQ